VGAGGRAAVTEKKGRGWKYRSHDTVVDGVRFRSKLEADVYLRLKAAQQAGAITDLTCHPRFKVEINGVKVCVVELDFQYREADSARWRYLDAKGYDTRVSQLKRRLIKAVHGIDVEIVTR
jgi:hypothetical protein